ncbi:LAQU0S12e03026g1_1 [Lachancea quebecensis]|uniref:LAQU0S12e03026g1_1 n=1 Tax=Lachancea quebecensis TaxID=1654605 RepID=A0A0P1KUS6_9SACH|nr:LAQU0S12e03026g1_1 [Lachancea quebecensis]
MLITKCKSQITNILNSTRREQKQRSVYPYYIYTGKCLCSAWLAGAAEFCGRSPERAFISSFPRTKASRGERARAQTGASIGPVCCSTTNSVTRYKRKRSLLSTTLDYSVLMREREREWWGRIVEMGDYVSQALQKSSKPACWAIDNILECLRQAKACRDIRPAPTVVHLDDINLSSNPGASSESVTKYAVAGLPWAASNE